MDQWKWLHRFSYLIFYLVSAHIINHTILRSSPDEALGWMPIFYLLMIITVIVLQMSSFIKDVFYYRKGLKKDKE